MVEEPLTPEQAAQIYDILMEECGASASWRDYFIRLQTSEFIHEYRFQGELGFGGKFWIERDGWSVSCYQEDVTTERDRMIEAANTRLAVLFECMRAEAT